MDQLIISAALKSRHAYNQVTDLLDINRDLSPLSGQVLAAIGKYYANDTTVDSTAAEVIEAMLGIGSRSDKQLEALQTVLAGASNADVSPSNVITLILDHKRDRLLGDLAIASAERRVKDVDRLIESYNTLPTDTKGNDQIEVSTGLAVQDLLKEIRGANQFQLYPKSLNERIGGGANRGHHIGIFALPDTGKTAFTINLVGGLCVKGHKVLYLGNEDSAPIITLRLISRLTNLTLAEVEAQPDKATETARSRGYRNFLFARLDPGSIHEIEELVVKHKPDVVIVDQIRNIQVKDSDGLTSTLERAGSKFRTLALKYKFLGISITQAGDNASAQLVLDRRHIDSSKVGYVASLDLLIGLGINPEYAAKGWRMISLAGKNKLSLDKGYWPVQVELLKSKIIDLT